MPTTDAIIKVLLQTAGTEKVAQLETELRNLEEQLRSNVTAFGNFDAAALKANAALMQGADAIAQKKEELEDYIRSQKHLAEAQSATSRAAIEMSRVFQDFFSGGGFARPADALRAISNNIEGMSLSFANLSKVGLGGVLSSLWGPGGIILGLTVLSQINWDWLAKKISSIFDYEAADRFTSHVAQLEKKLEDIKNKKINVEFTGQAKQLEAEIARVNALLEKHRKEFERQVKPEAEAGEDVERLRIGKKGEFRPITAAVESEFITRAGEGIAPQLAAQERKIVDIVSERKKLWDLLHTIEGANLDVLNKYRAKKLEEGKAREELVKLQNNQLSITDHAKADLAKTVDEAEHATGEVQRAARERLAKIYEASKVPGAPEIGAKIARAASQSYAKFEERELNAALKEMQTEQAKRAEARHPEIVSEMERQLLKAGAGPIVPEEARRALAARFEPALAKAGELAPHEAARESAEKAGRDLEARFAARAGLPQEEQRRKVEEDLTLAIAKSTGAAEKAKEAEAKNRDIITTAQQEFFKQTQGGLKDISDQMRESVKQQTQLALIQRGVPIHAATVASIGMMQEAERKFVDRLGGLGQLPREERARIVRKELEEAPAKEIKGRIEAQPRPAVEAAAERMFFELSKGNVDAITPKVMNAVAEFVEKTLRSLGEKGVAAKVSARELTEEAKKKLEGRFAELQERPPAEQAARVKEELEDIHKKFQGADDRGGKERQKQTSTLESIYGSMKGEIEARILDQGDPAEIARALAEKMVAERGATPEAARQASEKIVEDAWKQAATSVQRFENMGMTTFQAVQAAMHELLQTMATMANHMGQMRGQFNQLGQQARGLRQGNFGRTFQNH